MPTTALTYIEYFRGNSQWFQAIARASVLFLLFSASTIIADDQPLRIGVYHNPPKILLNSDANSRQISGFFGELINEIARRENWRLEPVECEWRQCLTLLESGEIDLLPDVAISAERQEMMDFHQTPALHSWSQVFSRKDVNIDSLLDLDSKRLAVLNGSVQKRYLEQIEKEFNLSIAWIVIHSFQEGLELISKQEVDALATNNLFGSFHANEYKLQPTAIIFQPVQLFFAAPKNASSEQLTQIDFWLEQWLHQTDSPYQQILQNWQTSKTVMTIPVIVWIATGSLIILLGLLLIRLKHVKQEVYLTRDALRKQDDMFSDLLTTQQEEVHHLNYFDSLTGLANRRHFMEKIEKILADLHQKPSNGALMLLDIDGFRSLNDTLGHGLGDQLLTLVAERLKQLHLSSYSLARFGGDEFMLVLDQLSSNTNELLDEIEEAIECVNHSLSEPFRVNNQEISATVCFGIVTFSEKNNNPSELIQHAELALFDAKKAGRQQIRFFDKEMQAEAELRTEIELGLRQALKNDEFILFFQPQYRDQTLTGAEVLVRWKPTRGKIISPAAFIPIAEATGLILPMGHWILTEACHQLVRWSKSPKTDHLILAVNISVVQMRTKDFVSQVIDILKATQAPANRLEFELTESMLIEEVEDTILKINQLKKLGISFSIDDFGTGFSSLSMLTRFPLDTLKVDQAFVAEMHRDKRDLNVVKTIVELGRGLDLNVIAEGVETLEQKEMLQQLGCHHYQGYYFARPMPILEFNELHQLTDDKA